MWDASSSRLSIDCKMEAHTSVDQPVGKGHLELRHSKSGRTG